MSEEIVTVGLGERSYDIVVGPGLIADAGSRIAATTGAKRVVVATDETVAGHHLEPMRASLDRAGLRHDTIVLPAGETTKSFTFLQALCERTLGFGIDRGSLMVALGGGVVGDLVGFAASMLVRGLGFVQVPTTLLSQVDSAVGGKTAINVPAGKNLVGAFHQPVLVLADTAALSTLPRRELLAGYAEVVKYGLIDDPGFFAWLESNGAALIDGDHAARRHAVVTSCRAKATIVARDERETGDRALLNLGHTFGHALEAETGYGAGLLHGEAVAIGMVMAFELSAAMGLCPTEDVRRVRRHLEAVGLPTGLRRVRNEAWTADRLLAHMAKDKKVRDGKITFILTRGIGKAFIARDVPSDAVAGILTEAIAA